MIVEIVCSFQSENGLCVESRTYMDAGVREYSMVNPVKECTTKYHFEEDGACHCSFFGGAESGNLSEAALHLHSGAFRIAPAAGEPLLPILK